MQPTYMYGCWDRLREEPAPLLPTEPVLPEGGEEEKG